MNIDPAQILASDKRDLELRILISEHFPEILPKPWKHQWHDGRCVCGADVNFDEPILPKGGCPIPDPIALDWNLAKRMQGDCDLSRFANAMFKICEFVYSRELDDINDIDYVDGWAAYDAKECHLILAACMTMEPE